MLDHAYYHIGILVRNLQEAVEHYSNLLDIRFTEPAQASVFIENPQTQQTETTNLIAVYSRTRAPYVELLQTTGDGIFSEKNAGGILYFGIWEPDIDARIKNLEEQGIGIDALLRAAPGKSVYAIITAPDKMGVRMEYVKELLRPVTEAWVLTGKYPLHDRS
jgi:catechol 2,3-dioxygenase-like lactoylglutathione lyase family enzyme